MQQTCEIKDRAGYLTRMGASLQEKMQMVHYFPGNPRRILDVGCADGIVTTAIAGMYLEEQPEDPPEVLGIDLDKGFLSRARRRCVDVRNVHFRRAWLRDIVNETYRGAERFDVVSFFSVLHEFYTYGEGMPSVMKGLADAHQVLNVGGVMAIRDMILHKSAHDSDLRVPEVLDKVKDKEFVHPYLEDHEEWFGKIRTVAHMNHFLLKYFYTENWDREGKENYIPVTFEDYHQMLKLLDMQILYQDVYLMPYLKNKWQEDFGLTDDEVRVFRSTGILIARKNNQASGGVLTGG